VNKYFSIILLSLFITLNVSAQDQSYVQEGEVGVTIGTAHYFGDLNNRADVSRIKPSFGVFFRKQFGNYIGVRLSGRYAQLGFSDQYSKNEVQNLRNLSFNTNVFEVALQGDFNFFRFEPGSPYYNFTPYVTLGVGLFTYDPYAYLQGEKYFLRPLGTEGQNVPSLNKKQYGTTAIAIPFGVGLKYSITDRLNVSLEVAHRFTNTDYLDDVSSQYAGIENFELNSPAALLQDRSYELSPNKVIGIRGAQRGNSKQKDQYMIAEFGISFNINSYRCPTAN
jgi:hypothetical protein